MGGTNGIKVLNILSNPFIASQSHCYVTNPQNVVTRLPILFCNFILTLKTNSMSANKNPQAANNKGSDNRSDMRKHQYKDHKEVLTNDENYDVDTQKFKGELPDLDVKMNNEEKK